MQPNDVDKWLDEKLSHKKINDEFGFTGEYRLCQKDLIDFMIDNKGLDLIKKQKEYIQLLTDELTEIVAIAAIHGWKSQRFEKGKELRQEIDFLSGTEKKLTIP